MISLQKTTTTRRGHHHHHHCPSHRLSPTTTTTVVNISSSLCLGLSLLLLVSTVSPVAPQLPGSSSSSDRSRLTLAGQQHVADLCGGGPVETAAEVVFADGVRRLFLSSGPYYWLINATDERPEVAAAAKIPLEFLPDVALLRNSSACSSSGQQWSPVSLVLIQMKPNEDGTEVEWLTLEVTLGDWWSATETINGSAVADPQLRWGAVSKIAQCDLVEQVCFKTTGGRNLANYFATMSFDFKRKLDAAFGALGETAYFIQDKSLYKVLYKNQCIGNPYLDVVAFPSVDIGTTTTAAAFINHSSTVVFFDGELHLKVTNASGVIGEEGALRQRLVDLGSWAENGHCFFEKCPPLESAWFSWLLELELFSSSKKHYAKRQILLISSATLILALSLLICCFLFIGLLKRRRRRRGSNLEKTAQAEGGAGGAGGVGGDGAGGEQLIEQVDMVDVKTGAGGDGNGEQAKTLLQTSC